MRARASSRSTASSRGTAHAVDTGNSAEVAALQATLAAEQAAIYGYGVVGSHLDGPAQATARSDWTAHQAAADKLAALLRSLGVIPAPAAVAYQLPHQVNSATQALALAATLEDQVTSAYLTLVALNEPSLRVLGARQVRVCALRAAAWRGHTVAFPGLPASILTRTPPATTPAATTPPTTPPASGGAIRAAAPNG
jgi:hypothetical protein